MKIKVYAKEPKSLFEKIISDLKKGNIINTWNYKIVDSEFFLFHKNEKDNWKGIYIVKFKYFKEDDKIGIIFKIKNDKDIDTNHGYILGRFIEVLMVHYYYDLDYIEIR